MKTTFALLRSLPRLLAWKRRAVERCWTPPYGIGYMALVERWRVDFCDSVA